MHQASMRLSCINTFQTEVYIFIGVVQLRGDGKAQSVRLGIMHYLQTNSRPREDTGIGLVRYTPNLWDGGRREQAAGEYRQLLRVVNSATCTSVKKIRFQHPPHVPWPGKHLIKETM